MSKCEKQIRLKELLTNINIPFKLIGCDEVFVTDISNPELAKDENSLVFVMGCDQKSYDRISNSRSSIIICSKEIVITSIKRKLKALVLVENPKLFFLRLIKQNYIKQNEDYGIHPSAYLDENVLISDKVIIGPNVYISKNVRIGNNTIIQNNSVIFDNVQIGNNVIIYPGVVIGSAGLGHIKNEFGQLENFPHLGTVVISDNVEIGPNSTIVRGSLQDTLISRNCKIDCQVQIGHNVYLGENVLIGAGSVVGGSAKIGNNVWVGINSTIFDYVSIASDSVVGGGTIVTKSLDSKSTIVSIPSRIFKKFN